MPDGGNFELSPMYHSIMLEDILDIINFSASHPKKIPNDLIAKLSECSVKMLRWLFYMSHNDGEISFFNDAAFGIANTAKQLESTPEA